MRAGAETTSAAIAASFESEESSVFCSKAGLDSKGANVEKGGFLDDGGEGALAECTDKKYCFFFEVIKPGDSFFGDVPGIFVLSGVVVADIVFAGFFWSPCLPVREVPGNQESDFFCLLFSLL